MKSLPFACLLLLISFFSGIAHSAVWVAHRNWDAQAEQKYAQWISKNIQIDTLRNWGISTDCADVAVALRWIFARQNDLPVLQNASNGAMIGNEASAWDSYPTSENWLEDKRFQVALRQVLNMTSTATLLLDAYPVKIQKGSVAAGAFYLRRYQGNGHLDMLTRVGSASLGWPITLFASTVPSAVRDLTSMPFLRMAAPKLGEGGLMRFRWPMRANGKWVLMSASSMPDYSLEQYSMRISARYNSFDQWVFEKMGYQTVDAENRLFKVIDSLIARWLTRVEVIKKGLAYCNQNRPCKEDTRAYDDWSTPSRDLSIDYLVQALDQLVQLNPDPNEAARLQNLILKSEDSSFLEVQGQILSFGKLLSIWRTGKFDSSPNVSELKRWGLE